MAGRLERYAERVEIERDEARDGGEREQRIGRVLHVSALPPAALAGRFAASTSTSSSLRRNIASALIVVIGAARPRGGSSFGKSSRHLGAPARERPPHRIHCLCRYL